jgi:hypothetical protein
LDLQKIPRFELYPSENGTNNMVDF